jgi:hypothetical protein
MGDSVPAGQTVKEPQAPARAGENPSEYCPQCGARLENRSCKLICRGCGYYMSCSDFI